MPLEPLLPGSAERLEQFDEMERLLKLCEIQAVRSGVPLPLGASARGSGVNFAIFSRHATGARIDFFDRVDDSAPRRTILLDGVRNKTGDIWHVWLEGIRPGQLYGFRFTGPYAPHEGQRFNPDKLLVDPHAKSVASVPGFDFQPALGYDLASPLKDLSFSGSDDAATAPKCVITHPDFDWQGDQPLRHPWGATVIYELHVRGYNRSSHDSPQPRRFIPRDLPGPHRKDTLPERPGGDGRGTDARPGIQRESS